MSTSLFGSFTVGEQRHWSLLKGLASAFDLRGDTRKLYVFYATEDEDTYHALRDDWSAIGDDLRVTFKANPAPAVTRVKSVEPSAGTGVRAKSVRASKVSPLRDTGPVYVKANNVLVLTVGPRHGSPWEKEKAEGRKTGSYKVGGVHGRCLGPASR